MNTHNERICLVCGKDIEDFHRRDMKTCSGRCRYLLCMSKKQPQEQTNVLESVSNTEDEVYNFIKSKIDLGLSPEIITRLCVKRFDISLSKVMDVYKCLLDVREG